MEPRQLPDEPETHKKTRPMLKLDNTGTKPNARQTRVETPHMLIEADTGTNKPNTTGSHKIPTIGKLQAATSCVQRSCPNKAWGCNRRSPNNKEITTVEEAQYLANMHLTVRPMNPEVIQRKKERRDKVQPKRQQ